MSRSWRVLAVLLGLISIQTLGAAAQSLQPWTPQQVIPGYADETWPPVLVADQNRTVHALASQPVDEQGDVGIIYSQWTAQDGWSLPNDILLSPLKDTALVLDALLDDQGVIHLVYYGGDNTEANIYYSQARVTDAARASAWLEAEVVGEDAASPPAAALTIDGQGNLVLVYNGSRDGNGVYVAYSADSGFSWSEPVPLSPASTTVEELWPYDIGLSVDKSGTVHAVWNVLNLAGQGEGIFYAKLDAESMEWSDPIELSKGDQVLELGTMTPAITATDDRIVALYNVHGKIVMRESTDFGNTWSNSVEIFPRHSGVNGRLAFAEDGSGTLHVLFGQRITGDPDIHGMWHSTMQDGRWLDPQAVISGPQIADRRENRAFDPYAARAVASQGNILLVTWRSDPGLKGNGVWFSSTTLDIAENPVVPWPEITATPTPTAELTTTVTAVVAPPPAPLTTALQLSRVEVASRNSPATLLIIGLGPTMVVLAALLVMRRIGQRGHR